MTSIGILCYNTINLGDWTQTAAALYIWWDYFEKPDTFKQFVQDCITTSYIKNYPITWIERDEISLTAKPNGVDNVILICNAWMMHTKNDRYNFPPPNWIHTTAPTCPPRNKKERIKCIIQRDCLPSP